MSSDQHENGSPAGERQEAPAQTEHLNIKVTDNNNEVFFKIKKSTKLEKLMGAFCERQGKTVNSVRFLFEGQRVQPNDTPDTVRLPTSPLLPAISLLLLLPPAYDKKRARVAPSHFA
ncbi:SUMO protein smt3 [Diaporthe australafricana]|uniref:SUMO protein smt3 n=1 Tax=Diaporthe australafricana TaxID=127596 RepID=A0ABR3WYH3_9PEZI